MAESAIKSVRSTHLATWNVCGLGKPHKQATVARWCCNSGMDVIALTEVHCCSRSKLEEFKACLKNGWHFYLAMAKEMASFWCGILPE